MDMALAGVAFTKSSAEKYLTSEPIDAALPDINQRPKKPLSTSEIDDL